MKSCASGFLFGLPVLKDPIRSAVMICLWATVASAHLIAEEHTFHFKMPENVSFVLTMRMQKSVQQGTGEPQKTIAESMGHYTIRKTAKGYSVYVKPEKAPDIVASDDVSIHVNSLISRMEFRYDIDSQGKLIRIANIEKSIADIKSVFSDDERALVDATGIFNADFVRQQLAAQWKVLGLFDIYSLAASAITINQKMHREATYPSIMAGAFNAMGEMSMEGPLRCGKNETCYQMVSAGTSRDPNIGKAFADTLSNMLGGTMELLARLTSSPLPSLPEFTVTDAKENVSMQRVFSETTGLQHRYLQTNDVTATFTVKDDAGAEQQKMRIKVAYDYSFDFK